MSLRDRMLRAGALCLMSTLAASCDAAAARAPGRPLPDTVLALIGERRTVGINAFRRGWAQVAPPARPDSLTPEGAQRFLDLLIDKEALAQRALEERWVWSPGESAQVASLRDRMMMRVALDSALAGAVRDYSAQGEPPPDPEALGVALRESTVARLAATYDEALLARLARAFAVIPQPSADSSIAARMRAVGPRPTIEPADVARAVASSSVGAYGVAELLDAWDKLSPLFRPRVASAEQVRDLVKNGLYQRALRLEAERRRLDRHPRVVDAMERQREYLAVQHLVARDVYAGIPVDSLTLLRYYRRDPEAWSVPARLRVVSLLLASRGEAMRMAVQLRDPAAAESLVALGLRQGVDYRAEIAARGDSALFAAGLRAGTGAVLGPDSVGGGWQVVQVGALLPARPRAFEEAREEVASAWSGVEGSRRLAALLARLRKHARVTVNRPALDRLVREGPARD